MSVTGKSGVGIPIILLHDGEGAIVTIELKTGDMYRGYLEDSEDNMNCTLKDVTRTTADGKVSHVDYVFVRGSQVLFIVFPNMLRHAPMFKRITIWRKFKGHPPQNLGAATGPRGQAAAIIRKAQQRQGDAGAPMGGGGPPPMGAPMGGPPMGGPPPPMGGGPPGYGRPPMMGQGPPPGYGGPGGPGGGGYGGGPPPGYRGPPPGYGR